MGTRRKSQKRHVVSTGNLREITFAKRVKPTPAPGDIFSWRGASYWLVSSVTTGGRSHGP